MQSKGLSRVFEKAKWLSEEALQVAEKRREEKQRQRRKEKIHLPECR